MKTRTLLLLAVACGLVILVAGSIKIFLIADDTSVPKLGVGDAATVSDMSVRVLSVDRSADQTVVEIEISGVDDPDGATTFFYGIGGKDELRPVAARAADLPDCAATSAGTPTRCVLAFDTTRAGVLRYERSDAEPARWELLG